MNSRMQKRMNESLEKIEKRLKTIFSNCTANADLYEAMEYSLLAGGKRIRPLLTLETCRMCGASPEDALDFACALEMVHTYSLIHDDLPAMDDSDLRRGRKTNHILYGEATAILAGDGLLTAAFSVIANSGRSVDSIANAVACLADAAGPAGMVGGQALDLAGEGCNLGVAELERLQSLKTGALISAAAELGCIAADGTEQQRSAVRLYAQKLGRAFQIRDDVLDVTSDAAQMGKPVGHDSETEKSTFVTALGLEACLHLIDELTEEAISALNQFEENEFHIWLARSLAVRAN